jgi:DNA repair exonuclease SbcCD nuclease subunit
VIKIAILSDSHWDINSRWDETLRVHDWFVNDIKEREVNAILHAGDFGPLVPIRQFKPIERLAVAGFIKAITDHCPFVGVKGNHDIYLDLAIFNELQTKWPARIMETPDVEIVTANNGEKFVVPGMPWPVKGELMARLEAVCGCEQARKRGECDACENAGLSPDQKEHITTDLMRNVFLGLGARTRTLDLPSVFLMHAMVRASRVSTGQPIAPGQDFEIGQEDLGLVDADFYALGHVHMSQEWNWNGATIAYCGSPRRTNYGEREEKSYILLTFDLEVCGCSQGYTRGTCPVCENHGSVDWERILIPCTPMLFFDCLWIEEYGFTYEGTSFFPECAAEKGAELRFRYSVASDYRDAAKAAALEVDKQLRQYGCLDVKVEEVVIQTSRARAEEITKAQTVEEKLQVLWTVREGIPSPERQTELFSKLGELERQVQSEA